MLNIKIEKADDGNKFKDRVLVKDPAHHRAYFRTQTKNREGDKAGEDGPDIDSITSMRSTVKRNLSDTFDLIGKMADAILMVLDAKLKRLSDPELRKDAFVYGMRLIKQSIMAVALDSVGAGMSNLEYNFLGDSALMAIGIKDVLRKKYSVKLAGMQQAEAEAEDQAAHEAEQKMKKSIEYMGLEKSFHKSTIKNYETLIEKAASSFDDVDLFNKFVELSDKIDDSFVKFLSKYEYTPSKPSKNIDLDGDMKEATAIIMGIPKMLRHGLQKFQNRKLTRNYVKQEN